MDAIKEFIVKNFEGFFVLIVLAGTVFINYFVTYKLAFLNVYFIPVILAAYYLDLRKALLGGLACILMALIYMQLSPTSFDVGTSMFDRFMNIFTWGCFLLLTGIVVGDLHQKLQTEIRQTQKLNQDLMEKQGKLEAAGRDIKDYAQNLEKKVAERTDSLERSKQAIEDLKKKVEDALYSTMDPSVVKMMIEKRLHSEKRRISILFADLKGFTRYSEQRRPEMVTADLNRFLEEIEEILLGYHAHIDKYMGDGIMVEFGAPINYERHALLSVIAGLKMQQTTGRGKFPWPMRIGIATGESVIGLVGNYRQTYTAIGDTVNLAARIQELCLPGQITIDESTYEEVHRFVDCKRKVVAHFSEPSDPQVERQLQDILQKLDETPNDPELTKKAAYLFLDANDAVNAHAYLQKAMELDAKDERIKVAFADASLKLSQMGPISIRGKEKKLYLYEVLGIKDPLADREKIPQKLYDAYRAPVSQRAEYPEDLVLPIEALEACVGHSRVVGFLSYAMADMLDLPDQEKNDIITAGYLADIGKIIIPHHLLGRIEILGETEQEEVKKHCRESVRMLKKMGYENEAIFEIIAAHHERLDGSGYPEGLGAKDIPVGAQIVQVADMYDMMTSCRSHRDRWDYRVAYAEIQREAGKGTLDGKVVACLGRLLEIAA
ncbi:MAG TPA: hypothetical protein DEB40_05240 [Elusimicrobia bacterium]|nr:hypothetical protein [Elusimicrobiota bacterium]HBT61129.1 hypothetical protein [Elusimicrobiota bacterium]